jgi:hypothetical protein
MKSGRNKNKLGYANYSIEDLNHEKRPVLGQFCSPFWTKFAYISMAIR